MWQGLVVGGGYGQRKAENLRGQAPAQGRVMNSDEFSQGGVLKTPNISQCLCLARYSA